MIIDLRRPTPVLDPSRWVDVQAIRQASEIHLSLGFAGAIGGPGAEIFARLLDSVASPDSGAKIVWYVERALLNIDRTESEIARKAAGPWLEKTPKPFCLVLPSDKSDETSKILHQFELQQPVEIRVLQKTNPLEEDAAFGEYQSFMREAFPQFSTLVSGKELREQLSAYARELPEVFDSAFEGLRFFAGFLRKKKLREAAEAFAFDWAHLMALFSPQDEKLESERLAHESVIANPTLQIVQTEENGTRRVRCWFRIKAEVVEKTISVFAAALLDQVHENPRTSKGEIIREAQRETQLSEFELQKAFTQLCTQGLLLIGE
jgi:hypothetical protein